MRIVRSTIAAADVLGLVREHYAGFSQNAGCGLEYRGVNDVYRCTDNQGRRFYFKIYARKEIDQTAVEGEVEVVRYLSQSWFPTADVIARTDGGHIVPIEVPEGIRFGVLFAEAPGTPLNHAPDTAQTTAVGSLVADLHTLLDGMPTTPHRWNLDEGLFLEHSLAILEAYYPANPQMDLPFFREVVRELKGRIAAQAGNWRRGLCHGDIYTGNIHRTDDGCLSLYDFDFCGYGWRAYDVSPFLGNFSAGTGSDAMAQREQRQEAFLRGYTPAAGFSDAELDAVYRVFVPFRRMFNLGYLYDTLEVVWGNRLRREMIAQDTRLLQAWVDHFW
ncbi:MAG: phosphotransferase [Anaerolineae bacterium]|nr:phosphotransferase [Anaerolineae bacterium]